MNEVETYWHAVAAIEAAIRERRFDAMERHFSTLAGSDVPRSDPAAARATAHALRQCFSDLHDHLFRNQARNADELIRTFEHVLELPMPVPLLSGLIALTLIGTTIASQLSWTVGGRGAVPETTLEICDRTLDRVSAVAATDAYVETARGIVSYAKGDPERAFVHFQRAESCLDPCNGLSAQSHLMWGYRGVCSTLSEGDISRYLRLPACPPEPAGSVPASDVEDFVAFAASDWKYFKAFGANLARSFFAANPSGTLHLHVIVAPEYPLQDLLLFHRDQSQPVARRLGVSWSNVPPELACLAGGDPEDTMRSYFTIVRFLFSSWIMEAYQQPLFVHDMDLTVVRGWQETFEWCSARAASVGHDSGWGYARCMPWFDRLAGRTLINNDGPGRFYARSLAKVGWNHFLRPRPLRYNIDQNLISSLTRYCERYVNAFRPVEFDPALVSAAVDSRVDPTMRGVRNGLG